jgi:hypothetical protein
MLEVLEEAGPEVTAAEEIREETAAGTDDGLKITLVEDPPSEPPQPPDSTVPKENPDDKKEIDPDKFILF